MELASGEEFFMGGGQELGSGKKPERQPVESSWVASSTKQEQDAVAISHSSR